MYECSCIKRSLYGEWILLQFVIFCYNSLSFFNKENVELWIQCKFSPPSIYEILKHHESQKIIQYGFSLQRSTADLLTCRTYLQQLYSPMMGLNW